MATVERIVFLGDMDLPAMTSSTDPGLYAVRVTGPGGYQSEFFVLASCPESAEDRWRKHGTKMRPRVADAIFGGVK